MALMGSAALHPSYDFCKFKCSSLKGERRSAKKGLYMGGHASGLSVSNFQNFISVNQNSGFSTILFLKI